MIAHISEQLKNGDILRNHLPNNLIKKINKYLYRQKNDEFFQNKLYDLATRYPDPPVYWKFMIRDSKNIKISKGQDRNRCNFANFLFYVLQQKRQNLILLGPYLQVFCIQAILNNPDIIQSQYYVGNGCSTAYQLLASYLIYRHIRGSPQRKCKQIQTHVFNIFKCIIDNKYIHFYYSSVYRLFCSLHLSSMVTEWTAQTVDLVLSYPMRIFTYEVVEDGWKNKQWILQYTNLIGYNLNYFFGHLFENYLGKWKYNPNQKMNKYIYSTLQEYQKDIAQIKPCMENIIKALDRNTYIVHELSELIIQGIFKANSVKLISFLLKFQSFRMVMLDQRFICRVFQSRYREWAQKLWNYGDNKHKISKMKIKGMNILQITCKSYGLSHNLISLMWQSGLFKEMPQIKNKKSQKIIKNKHQL